METRMETRQRPHKRFIGQIEVGPNGGPFTTATVTAGKGYRPDFRGWPNYVGVNEFYAVTEAPA